MKKTITLLALTLAAPVIWAQTTKTEKTETTVTPTEKQTTTTTTTTTGTGTITEYAPGKTIIVKEEGGPKTYTFGKKVVYVNRAGAVIPEAELQTRMRVGAPVTVHYVKEADGMTVSRVVVGD